MRRKDFLFEDKEFIETMLSTIEFGVMALPDVVPYAVPISFCFKDDEIYFHGAKAGRKYEILKNNPKVSFNAVKVYSYIPSSFLNHTMIPTQFFFSVCIEGQFEVVEDLAKKRIMLEALVKKYEKDNADMSMKDKQFENKEKGVFAGVIKVEKLSAKAKFGQNIKEEDIKIIIEDLRNRALDLDFKTIEMIQKMRA